MPGKRRAFENYDVNCEDFRKEREITFLASFYLECPLCCKGRNCIEAFPSKIDRHLNLSTKAKVHILPTLDLVEINPELRLSKEDVFGALPRTSLSPEINET